jgi:hypothetical protein
MFKAYGEFVRNSGNHPGFRFERLDQEILELPDAYSTRNGEVLLAMRRSETLPLSGLKTVLLKSAGADILPPGSLSGTFFLKTATVTKTP